MVNKTAQLKPSNTHDKLWLAESCMCTKHLETFAPRDIGRWLFFYRKEDIDRQWHLAKDASAWNDGLTDILYMEVSTAANKTIEDGVYAIAFYCSDSNNQKYITLVGRLLLKDIDYQGRIYYQRGEAGTPIPADIRTTCLYTIVDDYILGDNVDSTEIGTTLPCFTECITLNELSTVLQTTNAVATKN